MKVLDLFSGIGGFSLGLERAGFETVAFCEIEPYCQKVLAKHWPEVPIYDDIRKLDGRKYRGTVNVVCGGYPCQPFSAAGKRNGEQDDRHLWPEMFRIIKECRPTWVCCENVAGHITMGLDTVLSDLESESYTCQPLVIPACAVDAPHRRDRVWIIAHANEHGNGKQYQHEKKRRDSERALHDVADSDSDSGERLKPCRVNPQGWPQQDQRQTGSCGDGFRRWPTKPGVCRVANGIPNRAHRIKALGNAVVPQITQRIGEAIMRAEHEF